jgi:hypothetical protein
MGRAAVVQLVLVISACQSARKESKPDTERSREREAEVEPVRDSVQSSVLEVRERTSAGDLGAADRAVRTGSVPATAPEQPDAPAVTPRSPAAANHPRALSKSDTLRFGRLKAAIERANAEIERHRPRSGQ